MDFQFCSIPVTLMQLRQQNIMVEVTQMFLMRTNHHSHRNLWGLVIVRLLWLSGRALAAQARGVLGSTPGSRPFHFPLYSPHNI